MNNKSIFEKLQEMNDLLDKWTVEEFVEHANKVKLRNSKIKNENYEMLEYNTSKYLDRINTSVFENNNMDLVIAA